MTEYIEREALAKDVMESKNFNRHVDPVAIRTHRHEHEHFLKMIGCQPAADVVPAVHGRWKYDNSVNFWKCSHCGVNAPLQGNFMQLKTKYCPNCGARMDGDPNA